MLWRGCSVNEVNSGSDGDDGGAQYRHRLDPTRFVLMDQINSTGDVVDYWDFM